MSEIDVSKCEHYFCGECRNDRTEFEGCTKNANCYYKQLQQLKAENEKYKQCLNEILEQIKSIEATAERIFEDNCITLARAILKYSRNILQLIKQAKEE